MIEWRWYIIHWDNMKYIMNKKEYIYIWFLLYIYILYIQYIVGNGNVIFPFLEVYIPYYDLFKYRLNNYLWISSV